MRTGMTSLTWVLAAAFAAAGYLAEGAGGLLLGAALGAMLGQQIALGTRVAALERRTVPRPPSARAAEATAGAAEATAPEPRGSGRPAHDEAPRLKADLRAQAPGRMSPHINRAATALVSFFTGGNLVVKVGAVILFLGLAFLVRYAISHSEVPLAVRLSGIGATGLVLLLIGWRLRRRPDHYGVIMQGLGLAVLYLTLFSAARFYDLLPLSAAFGAMAVVAAGSAVLAVQQNAQSLAVLAVAGGFLAPVLTASAEGNHVALFSYLAVLNLTVLGMAWFRAWRLLNWLSFVFTAGIGTLWGVNAYRPELYATTQPFLGAFFLFYVAIATLFTRQDARSWQGAVDGTLVFGAPITFFALQAPLVDDMAYGLAVSAFATGCLYLALVVHLSRRGALGGMLGQSFFVLAVVFASLTLPFALDDQRWTAAAWALEGAGLLWVGVRQGRPTGRALGLILQGAAALVFIGMWSRTTGDLVVGNSRYLGCVMLAGAAAFSSYVIYTHRAAVHRVERGVGGLLLYWGLTLWLIGAAAEALDLPERAPALALVGLYAAATMLGLTLLGQRLAWPPALTPTWGLLPGLIVMLGAATMTGYQPFGQAGWLVWPTVLAVALWQLARFEPPDNADMPRRLVASHGAWYALATLVCTAAAARWLGVLTVGSSPLGDGWAVAAWGLLPAVALHGARLLHGTVEWPFGRHGAAYLGEGQTALAGALGAWLVLSAASPADPAPLPFVPLFNPVEVSALIAIGVTLLWVSGQRRHVLSPSVPLMQALVAGTALWLLMTATARYVHVFHHVRYTVNDLLASATYHTGLAIVWTAVALALMATAARRGRRSVWLAGAALLGLVIVKLVFVDLANVGTLQRIVSFVTVGVLTLVIGYVAPLPPKRVAGETAPPSGETAPSGEASPKGEAAS